MEFKKKEKIKGLTFCLLIIITLNFAGCTTIYFQSPMPKMEIDLKEVPMDIQGKYYVPTGNRNNFGISFGKQFYDIEKISKSHYVIYSYEEQEIDSVENQIKKWDKEKKYYPLMLKSQIF